MRKKTNNPNINILKKFSVNLHKAVMDTGLSPYALAKKINVDKDAIKNILQEGRDPKFSSVVKIVQGMQLSMDQLLGNIKTDKVQSPPVQKVENKLKHFSLFEKLDNMHEQDIELLEIIAGVLNERRTRAMKNLLNAIQHGKSKNKKEGSMTGFINDDDFDYEENDNDPAGSDFDDEDYDDTEDDEDFDEDEDSDYDEDEDNDNDEEDGFEYDDFD